ncbi:putative lipoyltransferase 2, mitochondrial [Blomia tropicalis]|nr:putative lipoyltransferase 2, mitochondrial [Blomia tropicalis]
MLLRIINLNRLRYQPALEIQQKLFANVKEAIGSSETPNYLLLVEHEPVYTVGIRSKQYNDQDFKRKLHDLGADFSVTNRGGLITFHGPGQLVAYPIINLTNFPATKRSIKTFVCILENTIIDLCKDLGIVAARLEPYPGVWVEQSRKIAALGIHASKYVTMHGVAINCDVDLDWFKHIVPCGIEEKTVTSISKELNKSVTVEQLNETT